MMLPIAIMMAVNIGMGIADWSMLLASNEANMGRSSVNLLSSACNFCASIVSSASSMRSDSGIRRATLRWNLWIVTAEGEKAPLVTRPIRNMDANSVLVLHGY